VSITRYSEHRRRIVGAGDPYASGLDLMIAITLLTGRSRPGSPADPTVRDRNDGMAGAQRL